MFSETHQIILKVTKGCNLACKYCYVKDKPEYNDQEMTDEVFDFTMRRWMTESTRPDLNLIFHGGEPLRIGKAKFSRFCNKAVRYASMHGKDLTLGVQTNATLIDSEWLAIFKMYDVSVGISWDGVGSKTDHRNNTQDLVLQKLVECKEAGVPSGFLTVLHQGNFESLETSYKTLYEHDILSGRVNRGVDTNVANQKDSSFECSAEQLVKAVDTTVDFMLAHPNFIENNILNTLRQWFARNSGYLPGLFNYEKGHCGVMYCGGLKNLIELDPDGSLRFCGRLSGTEKDKIAEAGTVFDRDPFETTLIQTQLRVQTPKKRAIDKFRCVECYAQSICDKGCVSYSLSKLEEPTIDMQTHTYYRALAKYLVENNTKVLKLHMMHNHQEGPQNECDSNQCMQ